MAGAQVLRLATAADREALIALQWKASLTSDVDRPHLLANPDAIDLPIEFITDGRTMLIEQDDRAVGFMVLLACQDGQCELDGMFVDPDCWRAGLGRRLVDAAADLAQREGATSIHVVANPAALEFYTACGFCDDGVAETQFGLAPTMRKVLRP